MNETKHTPGPWEITNPTRSHNVNVCSNDEGLIAEVHYVKDGWMQANTALISAAPDMLNALLNIRDWMNNNNIGHTAQIQAAIDKATVYDKLHGEITRIY